jgi:Tol biopolymer transport system component
MPLPLRQLLVVTLTSLCATACLAEPMQDAAPAPSPQIFAPGEISGPANDGAPTFSPDGNTLFYTRTTANWTVILESHLVKGHWSRPTLAPFSGEWPDSSPALSPDGTYLIFQSTRPITPLTAANTPRPGQPTPGIVSNLWRVDRLTSSSQSPSSSSSNAWPDSWSEPRRLPNTVNLPGQSIWKPSIASDGTIYLTAIDNKGSKRLYASQYKAGEYQPAQPLSFSDGATSDVDPEIAPDGSFLIFVSAGRLPGNPKDHLFIVLKQADGWGPVTPILYAGDEKPFGPSTDNEPRLGPDHRTLYFSSDRAVPVHFPRTHEQARLDLERMDLWDNSNSNIWSLPLSTWLSPATTKSNATR